MMMDGASSGRARTSSDGHRLAWGVRRHAWAAACTVVLSLAAIMVLGPITTAGRPSIMWRGFPGLGRPSSASTAAKACPSIDYGESACRSGLLHPPGPKTDEEVLEDMYHGFKCLRAAVVEPWAHSRAATQGSRLEIQRPRVRCGGGDKGTAALVNVTQEVASLESWRQLAKEQLCLLADSLYEAMVSCKHSLRRGMLVQSRRWAKQNDR